MEIFSTLLRACGAGLILSLCLNILSNVSGGYASVIRIAGSTFLFGVFLLFLKEGIQALMPTTTVFSENAVAVEGVVSMLKGLGIALISRFCADISDIRSRETEVIKAGCTPKSNANLLSNR